MTTAPAVAQAEAFFLEGSLGRLFCLFHPPAGPCRGAVLYVHPFAEEMNRSRRMAALQARELAALGYGVLQPDLYGCGDSSGDFGDARWELWKDDLAHAATWLEARLGKPLTLWGLRLGALLAVDYARCAPHPLQSVLLWQPVTRGSAYLTQFLRLRMVNSLLDENVMRHGTSALRNALQQGETIEIAGYKLAPELATAIDSLDPIETMTLPCPVHWFETLVAAGQALPAGAARVSAAWRQHGVDLRLHPLPSPPFWTTPEITVSTAWLGATSAVMRAGHGN